MKLNPDCVRDILLHLETELPLNGYLMGKRIAANVNPNKYSTDDILYTLTKLKEAGLINANENNASNKFIMVTVSSITYEGHQYLEDIRSPKAWEFAKKKAEEMGSYSLKTLGMLAQQQISKMIYGEL
tara:strand:+ start:36 stop:419 length:384 start_codon:yes stop_codon:yes gene_type:complete